jgi:hypothetical protein
MDDKEGKETVGKEVEDGAGAPEGYAEAEG